MQLFGWQFAVAAGVNPRFFGGTNDWVRADGS
jgi:hypothetical protein